MPRRAPSSKKKHPRSSTCEQNLTGLGGTLNVKNFFEISQNRIKKNIFAK